MLAYEDARIATGETAAEQRLLADEERLLEGLRRRDEAAYEALVRAYGGRMLIAARRLLPSEEDARDAVQEAFLSAFRSVGRFKGDAKLSTWLHRIVVNAALMRIRYQKRRPETKLDDLLPSFKQDGHFDAITPVWHVTGEDEMIREETRALVRSKIDELPRDYRNVIRLRDVEGLSTDEAAKVLDTNTNVVKVRLHRARQALRTLLEPSVREDADALIPA